MFPRARKLLSAAELNELGARMAQRKQELLADGGRSKSAATRILQSVVEAIAPDAATEPPPPRRSTNGTSGERSRA
jgi:hypothetical protein